MAGERDLYIEVIGADRLRTIIGEVNAGFETKALAKANKAAAEYVRQLALPNVPVGKTGKLKDSLKTLASPKKGNVKAGTPSGVPYAAVIHWGRSTGALSYKHGRNAKPSKGPIKARPFLWNAKQQAFESGAIADAYDKACMELLDSFF